jgi:hypothetical protein
VIATPFTIKLTGIKYLWYKAKKMLGVPYGDDYSFCHSKIQYSSLYYVLSILPRYFRVKIWGEWVGESAIT